MEDHGAAQRWAELQTKAAPARERRRLDPDHRDQLIVDLCSLAPLSVRDLAQLLARTEAYTGDAIRPLVERGRIVFLYPDQPRHPKQRYVAPNSPAQQDGQRALLDETDEAAGVTAEEPIEPELWGHLEQVAKLARERKRLTPAVRDQLVLRLCEIVPLSARQLAALLGRSEAYVSDAVQPLVREGRLAFLYDGQPRHPRQKYVTRPPGDDALKVTSLVMEVADQAPLPEIVEPDIVHAAEPILSAASRLTAPAEALRPITPAVVPPAGPAIDSPASDPYSELAGEPQQAEEDTLLNATTSVVLAIAMGMVLALLQLPLWGLWALVLSALLATLHVVTDSIQYKRYRGLNPGRDQKAMFWGLKAFTAWVEISVVYLIAAALLR